MIMLKAYGEMHTEILLMEFDRKMTGTFVMGLNDIVIKACLLSCPAEKFEELVEKAVLTECILNFTNKSNVNWME